MGSAIWATDIEFTQAKGVMRVAKKEEKKTVYRDSGDGQFVTKDYAKKHPKTTESDRVPVTPPKRKK